ncbi:alpha/beta fold hydrolase [Ferruginibacter sp.]
MKRTILSMLFSASAFFASSCAKNDAGMNAKQNTYVLVHGAWQAPYVWDAVRTDLEKKGNKVIVVELPGHGADNTATYTLSIDAYSNKVIDAITKESDKVILVGHSMAGMVITNVAEKIPVKISKLVYIGAFLPAPGQTLENLSMTDPGSKLGPQLSQSADKLTLDVNKDSLTYLFINDGSAAAKQKVLDNYKAEPAIPFTNPVMWTNEKFGSVDKVYIKTLQDIVISPAMQDKMIATADIKTVYSLNTSHSPFLSQPKSVADLLYTIGQ